MAQLKIKKILVPLDFSFTSLKALDQAVNFAKLTEAEIILLHVAEHIHATTDPFFVVNPGIATYESDIQNMSNESLSKVAEKLKKKGVIKVKTLS
ncbi:MAG: universal stress protein, partial [Bacteroidota bacterium]